MSNQSQVSQIVNPPGNQINPDPPKNSWHIGKEIPLSMLLALLLQTGGAIWWAATLTNKLDNLVAQITDFKAEKYTKNDASRYADLVNYQFNSLNKRLDYLEKELEKKQSK